MSRALDSLCFDAVLAAKAVLVASRAGVCSAFSVESCVFRCCGIFALLSVVFPPFRSREKLSELRAGWVKLANRRGRFATSLHLIRAGGAQRSSCPAGPSGCRR